VSDVGELLERFGVELLVHALRIAAVGQQADREVALGRQPQERRLADRAAVVADDPVAAPVEPHPAESPGVGDGRVGQADLVAGHRLGRVGRQQPRAVRGDATRQVHPGEGEHVGDPRGDQSRRSGVAGEGPVGRRFRVGPGLTQVTDGGPVQDDFLGQGHRGGESHRLDDPLAKGRVPRRAGEDLDDPSATMNPELQQEKVAPCR
jgi:hypothetical protein